MSKPLYSVPTMAEVAALPWNGYHVISTFSGCGGSCLGYRMAGFKVRWANEFVPEAQATYKANHPESILDTRDIRRIQPEEILSATGLQPGELDLFDGSPPCASFSTAGKREKGWGKVKQYSDTTQRTDDLFFEYARLLRGLQPKVFVAENVRGLVIGSAKGYYLEIFRHLESCGYVVKSALIDAQWCGVPQSRSRIIFIGVRKDLGLSPVFPKPFTYRYSLKEALPHIRRAVHDTKGLFSTGDITHRPCPAITVGPKSLNSTHYLVEDAGPALAHYAIGVEWDKLKPGEKSDKYLNLVRPDPNKPCPTVTAMGGIVGAASVTHPTERRKFSIPELKRICSFPADFVLTGDYRQQWERLGRSVPPLMMKRIAETVRDEILCKLGNLTPK